MKGCFIYPQVQGQDSMLSKDILSFTSRNKGLSLYYEAKLGREKGLYTFTEFNSQNEPTLKNIIDNTDLIEEFTEQDIIEKSNRMYSEFSMPDSVFNRNAMYNKVKDLEKDYPFSRFFKLIVNKVGGLLGISTIKRDIGFPINKYDLSRNPEDRDTNSSLNSMLRDILRKKGISVGALSAFEERAEINGVTDFSQAEHFRSGLVELIRIANGEKGEEALPEEFAHFFLRALGEEEPLVKRLLTLSSNEEVIKEVLGEEYSRYKELYKDNPHLLAEEVAGKLLSKSIQEVYKSTSLPLVNRVLERVKGVIKSFSLSELIDAKVKAYKISDTIASRAFSRGFETNKHITELVSSDKLYNASAQINHLKEALDKIIETEEVRLKIYQNRSKNSTFVTSQNDLIRDLINYQNNNNELAGILSFLQNTISKLTSLNTRLQALNIAGDINNSAKTLREARNYIHSYINISTMLRVKYHEGKLAIPQTETDTLLGSLNMVDSLIRDAETQLRIKTKPVVIALFEETIGHTVEISFGKNKGIYTIEELLTEQIGDISIFDRWLDSMADSSSTVLKIFDQIVKQKKEKARLKTLEISKQILSLGKELEEQGIKDTNWMFERDSEGNFTGYYISRLNQGQFENDKKALEEELKKKYGDNLSTAEQREIKLAWKKFYLENTREVNGQLIPSDKYLNPEYDRILANPVLSKFYKDILEIKRKLDSLLPSNVTSLYNSIRIRKDMLERIQSASSVKDVLQSLKEDFKDTFTIREDDSNFGSGSFVDFEGNRVMNLPLYFLKSPKNTNPNDISTDVVSTMIAYANMANNYYQLEESIDALELAKGHILSKDFEIKEGDKLSYSRKAGKYIREKLAMPNNTSNTEDRLNDFFQMQVYGQMKDPSEAWAPAVDALIKYTAHTTLGINTISAVSNVLTGHLMAKIETVAGEFFSTSDLYNADLIYGGAIMDYIGEVGNRIKVSKLALFQELFNTLQDHEESIHSINFDRKTWATRMGTSAAFFLQNGGEHWMQNRTALALAVQTKLLYQGKLINLWEAYDVEYIDPNNPQRGAKLVLKEGVTKEDGSPLSNQDLFRYKRKVAGINNRLHGIYNQADKSALQKYALGRMAFLFRKWMRPAWNRRFAQSKKDFDLDTTTEGYYNTTYRFLKKLYSEFKESQLSINEEWDKLTKEEKANIRRASFEMSVFLIIGLLLRLIDFGDDDEDPWLSRMTRLQIERLYTELGSLTPTPFILKEGLKILDSPTATVNTLQNILDSIQLFNPFNWGFFAGEEAIIQEGRYEDYSKGQRLLFKLTPGVNNILKSGNPEDLLPFYTK